MQNILTASSLFALVLASNVASQGTETLTFSPSMGTQDATTMDVTLDEDASNIGDDGIPFNTVKINGNDVPLADLDWEYLEAGNKKKIRIEDDGAGPVKFSVDEEDTVSVKFEFTGDSGPTQSGSSAEFS